MNIFKRLLARQFGHNWTDRTKRGNGNHAARRAAQLVGYRDHCDWVGEDIYTDRPRVFLRADWLRANDYARAHGREISAQW